MLADFFGSDPIGWVVTLLVGLVVLFGAAIPAVRTNRAKATIELQNAELAAYQKAIDRFKDELAASEQRCHAQVSLMERRHADEMGELRGRIEALTPEFARKLAAYLREEGLHG